MKKKDSYPNIASLKGAAGKLGKRLWWEEMREIAYEDAWAKKYVKEVAWDDLMKVMDRNQKGGEKFTEEEVEADALAAVMEVRHGRSNLKKRHKK